MELPDDSLLLLSLWFTTFTTKAQRHKGRTKIQSMQSSLCHNEATKKKANTLSNAIIGAAIEVHQELGPGLLESAYEECLCYELGLRGIASERQVPLPVEYKGLKLECGYRIDLLVDDLIIIELKSVTNIEAIHEAQLFSVFAIQRFMAGNDYQFQCATA